MLQAFRVALAFNCAVIASVRAQVAEVGRAIAASCHEHGGCAAQQRALDV